MLPFMLWQLPPQRCARCLARADVAELVVATEIGGDGRELDVFVHADRDECREVLA